MIRGILIFIKILFLMLILFKNRFIKIIYSEFYNFNLDIAHQFFISISYLLFQKYS